MMSDEKKILEMLEHLRADMDVVKAEIEALKRDESDRRDVSAQRMSQKEVFRQMSELLSKEEQEDFGKFMDAEEARKAALYG